MNLRVAAFGLLGFILLFVLVAVSALSATSQPAQQFNVTPSTVYFNWTTSPQYSANITLTLNSTSALNTVNVNLTVVNSTTYFIGNYSQPNAPTCPNISVLVQNKTGGYTNTTETLNASSNVNSTNLILSPNLAAINGSCIPGRYTLQNKLLIINATSPSNTTENVTIDAVLDLPISTNTTLNSTTGIGTFNGTLPANAATYQSYYFYINNATTISNATGVTVTISWQNSSQYVSLFLLDGSGVLKAKSIQNGTTSQTLHYNFLPTVPSVWEIRVYGNSSTPITYNGALYFTTLNATNSSTPSQQISQINFGTLNASASQSTNITLTNAGPLNLSTITQSSDLYYVKTFSGNGAQNFTMLVPNSSIINAVNATVDWAGAGNYSLIIFDSSGNVLGQSANKFVNANVSNTIEEEYVNILPPNNSQILTFEVLNSSTTLPNYNLTVKLMYPASSWISTNYTSIAFSAGNSSTVQVNLTTQNTSLDGMYQGDLYYFDSNGAGLTIPIVFNVSTPTLSVNNSFDSQSVRIDEDYGATLTKTLNIYINNTGSINASLNMSLNSTNLVCTSASCGSYTANLSYNSTNLVPANSAVPIQINVTFNTSIPTGVYTGWIYFDATNSTTAFASHPSSSFNFTIQLNLTNLLNIKLVELDTPTGLNVFNNASTGGNISLKMNITYLNGTPTQSYTITPSNFAVWITEGNATAFGVNSNNNVTLSNLMNTSGSSTGSLFNSSSQLYLLNASIPANIPGGVYFVNTNLTVGPTSDFNGTFTGSFSNQSLIVNNTGIYLSLPAGNSSTVVIPGTATTATVYVNVTNVGPVAASGISLSLGTCSGWSVSGPTPATISPTAYSTGTIVSWVVSNTTTNSTDCSTLISGSAPAGIWFNNLTVVFHLASPYTPPPPQQTVTSTSTSPPTYLSIISYPSLVEVVQGLSNSTTVVVKNTNDTQTQLTTVSVVGLNSSWVSVATGAQSIAPGAQASYTITFSVPNDTNTTDYSGTFQAQSSFATVNQTFTLRVLPNNATQIAINQTFVQILANYTQVWKLYNESKAAGLNLTTVDPLFSSLQAQMQQVQNYMSQGTPEGYYQAQKLFTNIQSLIAETQQALQKIQPPGPNYLLYGIITAIVVGGLFVLYLFLPSSSPPTKQ